MEIFNIVISIIGVLSLVWIAAILTFIWAENSPLLKVFDEIDKSAKSINNDLSKIQRECAMPTDPIYEGRKEATDEIKDILRRNPKVEYIGTRKYNINYTKEAEIIKPTAPKKPAKKTVKKPAKKTTPKQSVKKPAKKTNKKR